MQQFFFNKQIVHPRPSILDHHRRTGNRRLAFQNGVMDWILLFDQAQFAPESAVGACGGGYEQWETDWCQIDYWLSDDGEICVSPGYDLPTGSGCGFR